METSLTVLAIRYDFIYTSTGNLALATEGLFKCPIRFCLYKN